MFPPISPPEIFAQSTLPRLGHSALPHAPVQRHVVPARRARRTAAVLVRVARSAARR